MKRGSRYQQFKARALSKPEIRKAYEEGMDDLRVAIRVAELREKRGMTQTDLAAKIHASEVVISRFERGKECGVENTPKSGRGA